MLNRHTLEMSARRILGNGVQERVRFSNNRILLRLRAALGQNHVILGRVTVVIPIYNVERYLRECLESVRVQTYPDLEVLMINDGSPDQSVLIAQEFSKRDRRFRLINQGNAGLGAARNTGIRLATGEYLTFVDSDDAIPPNAYRSMVTKLNKTKSDFVVGGVERWRSKSRWRDDWASRVHALDQDAITIDVLPEVTKDVFAWNKLYRTDFFREKVGYFPERILYEDQELTARAYLHCQSFDVLEETTYLWRIREDGSSITQNKLTERDLKDRITVAQRVERIYRESASESVYRYWLQKTAGLDFSYYYRLSHRGTDGYWNLLVNWIKQLQSLLTVSDWALVPAKERVLAQIIADEQRELVGKAIGAQAQFPNGLPVTVEDARFYIDLERWELPGDCLSKELLELSNIDTALKTGILSIEWEDAGSLRITGFAYIDKLPLTIDSSELSIEVIHGDGNRTSAPITRWSFAADDSRMPRTSFSEHAESGFTLILPVDELMQYSDKLELAVELNNGFVRRRGRLLPQNPSTIPVINPYASGSGELYLAEINRLQGFAIEKVSNPVDSTGVSVALREVRVTLRAADRDAARARVFAINRTLSAHAVSRNARLESDSPQDFVLNLPEPRRADRRSLESTWEFFVQIGSDTYPLAYPSMPAEGLKKLERGALALRAGRDGQLLLVDGPWNVVADEFIESSEGVLVRGTIAGSERTTPKVVLARLDGTLIQAESINQDGNGNFAVEFNLTGRPQWGKPFISPTSGTFGLCYMWPDQEDIFASSRPIYFSNRSQNGSYARLRTPAGHIEITDEGIHRSVLVRLQRPGVAQDLNNARRATRVETLRNESRKRPLRQQTMLCMSFSGASVHDSPAPIAAAMLESGLVHEVVWGVTNGTLEPPVGRAIPVDSAEFIQLLHESKYLLNNAHFPHYFRKREDQLYIQTWHGTPLKRIANDVPPSSLSDQYLDLMQREVKSWDLLLGQSPLAGDLLRSAFQYAGNMTTDGYPRNDWIADAENIQKLRRDFREDFGLDDRAVVAMYAPTWRDSASSSIGASSFETLDAQAVLDRLGPEARLLIRGHANTAQAEREIVDQRVLDVSGYSDLPKLFAATDLLITDYSSIFFDYAVTGKPIFGFVPDLENYTQVLRGTYFEYSDVFPGPIAKTNQDLLGLLGDWKSTEYRTSAILQDILHSERGTATKQVLEAVKNLEALD